MLTNDQLSPSELMDKIAAIAVVVEAKFPGASVEEKVALVSVLMDATGYDPKVRAEYLRKSSGGTDGM